MVLVIIATYLDINWLKWILNGHRKCLVEHWIQILVHGLALEQKPTALLELHVGIARSALIHRRQIVSAN